MTGMVEALERVALPAIIALLGSGGGLAAWLKSRQARQPWVELEARHKAAERAIEAKFHAEIATQDHQWKTKFSALERQMAALTQKVERLEADNERAWRRVGLLEGVLGENGIPIPEYDSA